MRSLGLGLLVVLVLGLAAPAAADPVVVTRDDAVQPRAGRDYTRLMSIHLGDDTLATNVTASGKVVLTHYSYTKPTRIRLLDPATGRRTPLPAPAKNPEVVRITAGTIWYSDTARVSGQTTVYRYDREKRRMRSFLLPDVAQRESYVNRTQILTTDGDQVATLQDSGADGWLPPGSDVVNVTVFGTPGGDRSGTYVYDLETDRFLRISDQISPWGLGGATGNARQFLWHTPVNDRKGATQHVGELK
jgi:streptogramin lyase